MSNPKSMAHMAKIAVTSVSSNDEVTWYGEQPASGLLVAAANLAANSSKSPEKNVAALLSRADVLVNEADAILIETLGASSASRVVPKDQVLATKAYGMAKERKAMGAAVLKPSAYKFVELKDAALAKGLKSEAGIDGSVLAYFQFNKMMKSGVAKNGVMGAMVMLNVQVVDAAGKMVFTKGYNMTSKEGIPVVAGVYDAEKLKAAFADATRAACQAFAADLSR
jgi:hypothetical protein